MPKETCHFILAEDVMTRLPSASVARACQSHVNLLYLGSVFHDALYYYTGNNPAVHQLADIFHGADGEDSFALLRSLGELAQSASTPDLQASFVAFRVGVASHIFADVHFHPMVYFFTGDYFATDPLERARAQHLHRKFEAQLDWHLAGPTLSSRRYRIAHQIAAARRPLKAVLTALAESPLVENIEVSELMSAYDNYAIAQRMYQNKTFMKLARRTKFLFPQNLRRTLEDLHSLRLIRTLEPDYAFFDAAIEYRHPVLGNSMITDIASLRRLAVNATVSHLTGEFDAPHGPSHETGLPKVGAREMVHFDTKFINQTAARL